jgi:hypothetical protein
VDEQDAGAAGPPDLVGGGDQLAHVFRGVLVLADGDARLGVDHDEGGLDFPASMDDGLLDLDRPNFDPALQPALAWLSAWPVSW